jgi:hypothetical protein
VAAVIWIKRLKSQFLTAAALVIFFMVSLKFDGTSELQRENRLGSFSSLTQSIHHLTENTKSRPGQTRAGHLTTLLTALTLRISANRVCGFVDNSPATPQKLTHRTTSLTRRRTRLLAFCFSLK